jgi:ABC-type multidrug transport system ATPase subunit
VIITKDLTKKYGTFCAVDHVSLNIPRGEIYGFLGPNGAGKTSTIMMLLGIIEPTEGEIYLFDKKYTPSDLALRKRIGVVPEKHPRGMWKWMTAYEYCDFFADFFDVNNKEQRIPYLLEKVELLDDAYKKINNFSRGMLQKLSIVRSLIHDPDILFMDEPISGLDPIGIKKVRDLILTENREGRTIFISSHLLSEMEKLCHRVAIIHRGTLIAEDRVGNLFQKIQKEKEILVECDYIPADLDKEMKELSFVHNVYHEGSTLFLKVSKEGDYRKDISQFLIKKDLVPLKIQEKMMSLEEAFTTITQENVGLLAGIGGS